jgi:MYXO-CTERM domain-containing protein
MRFLLGLLVFLAPQLAFACGGLFCNNTTPVNQSAERILFAPTEEGMDMHVRITYAGPPSDFGWLLPVPRDVDYGLSSEALFTQLDQNFAPTFVLRTEIDPGCQVDRAFASPAAGGAEGADSGVQTEENEPGVQVLSREAVGPYDLVVLLPDTVGALREWLTENEYQIPETADATLEPYVEMEAAFLALKLLAGSEAGDVQPIRMSFGGSTPAIPIVPTSVAADPDMGILVHLLGQSRAVPNNYRHVLINEAALDWGNRGQNYADVVSQAADEAGGQAFVTDFAGAHNDRLFFPTVDPANLERLRTIEDPAELLETVLFRSGLNGNGGDADLQRIVRSVITTNEGLDVNQVLGCPRCYSDRNGEGEGAEFSVDVDRLIASIEEQINEPRGRIAGVFDENPYLTRLYSTMSAHEMTVDPTFGYNQDLEDQANRRTAIRRVRCFMGNPDFDNAVIETPSGLRFRERDGGNPNVIVRQAGETIRGVDVPGAWIIEEPMVAGQPEILEDKTESINAISGINDDVGCACDATGTSGTGWFLVLGALLVPLFKRRRDDQL